MVRPSSLLCRSAASAGGRALSIVLCWIPLCLSPWARSYTGMFGIERGSVGGERARLVTEPRSHVKGFPSLLKSNTQAHEHCKPNIILCVEIQ